MGLKDQIPLFREGSPFDMEVFDNENIQFALKHSLERMLYVPAKAALDGQFKIRYCLEEELDGSD